MAEKSEDEEVGILIALKDITLTPLHAVLSPTARRAYLSTFLYALSSFLLIILAFAAYVAFYVSYVPVRGFEAPLYFQFDAASTAAGPAVVPPLAAAAQALTGSSSNAAASAAGNAANPYALVAFQPGYVVSDQGYDVHVTLVVPRSPQMQQVGNFMIDLALVGPAESGIASALKSPEKQDNVIVRERRPSLLTYVSPSLDTARKTVRLPWYVIGWSTEKETLVVPMMEGMKFSRGWRNVPVGARVELAVGSKEKAGLLQLYQAKIEFRAKLRGLRYLMYNWRLTSLIVFTTAFWIVEMVFMTVGWIFIAFVLNSGSASASTSKDKATVKSEVNPEVKAEIKSEVESDTKPFIKEEEQDNVHDYPLATEADIEDEEEEIELPVLVPSSSYRGVSDSGIGTSYDSGSTKPDTSTRRKRSSLGYD